MAGGIEMKNVVSLHYLGNIQYFTKLLKSDCIIDVHENYQKQSYRNRCNIMSANGVDSLIIQTIKGANYNKNSVLNTRIDYSKKWQHQHWQAIKSSYKNSPYFDYYYDQLEPFYTTHYEFLSDFNMRLLETVIKLLNLNITPCYSESYIKQSEDISDWRDSISPKPRLAKEDTSFHPQEYWQVFSEKHPFAGNLSIIDLLFCEGPGAKDILINNSL